MVYQRRIYPDVDVETIHTQTFQRVSKGFGVNTEHQLQIVEQCAHGVQRNRRPEFFFHGILGHVKDWYGQPIDTWTNANKISNYWRRFYEIPAVPYEESGTWEQPNVSAHDRYWEPNDPPSEPPYPEDSDSMVAEVGLHETPVPVQIHQLATTLYNVLIQDPEYNAPVLEMLHNDGSGTQTDPNTWSAEDLSQLASHLAITATQLARAVRQRSGALDEEWTDDDDGL